MIHRRYSGARSSPQNENYLAGLRTALVGVIASATLAAFIGAGGLDTLSFDHERNFGVNSVVHNLVIRNNSLKFFDID